MIVWMPETDIVTVRVSVAPVISEPAGTEPATSKASRARRRAPLFRSPVAPAKRRVPAPLLSSPSA